MPLDISTANKTAAQETVPWIVDFVEIDISTSENIRACSHIRDLSFDGKDYLAAGEFLGFGTVFDNYEAKDNDLSIQLSGVGSSYTASVLRADIEGSVVTVYRGYLNQTTGELVSDPTIRFKGRVDNFTIKDDHDFSNEDAIVITLSARNLLSTVVRRSSGRFTSPASFSDNSMEFVAPSADFSPKFGKE